MARVTLVVNNADEGSETFQHALAEHLLALGHDVQVHALLAGRSAMAGEGFSSTSGLRRSAALPPLRSRRALIAASSMVRRDPLLFGRLAGRALRRFGVTGRGARAVVLAGPLALGRPEVVHAGFSGIGLALLDAVELLDPSTQLVVSCRGSGELVTPVVDPPSRVQLARLFARADAVHCVADVVAARAIELGAPPDRVEVIRPAVHPASPQQPATCTQRGAGRVVTVARLHWVKGIEVQLDAARRLRDRGVEVDWSVVGDGPARTALELRARWMGLQDTVRFVGSLPPSQVDRVLQDADVFVLSSWSEGTANSALEAMARGVPVVSTAAGGMGEVLTDGVDAMVVALGDAGSLADAVERALGQPSVAAALAAQGRRTVSRGYTLDRQREQWGGLYEHLDVSRSARGGAR